MIAAGFCLSVVGAMLSAPSAQWQIAKPLISMQRTSSPFASMSAEETAALEAVVSITTSLKQFGVNDGDLGQLDSLTSAVNTLYDCMPPEPAIAVDPRLVGGWLLVGTTSSNMILRKGLTGLGAVPFSNICALHVSFTAEGKVTAKEVLSTFGKPVILNELRGTVSFTEDGDSMLESYDAADIGGQANSPSFGGVEFTLFESAITSCGTYRLGCDDGTGVYVFRRMREGLFDEYLDENQLPKSGGTYVGNPAWKGPVK